MARAESVVELNTMPTFNDKAPDLAQAQVIDRMTDIVACLNSCDSVQRFLLDIHCILQKITYADNFYVCLIDDEERLSFPYFSDIKDDISSDDLEGLCLSQLRQTLTAYALKSRTVCNFKQADIQRLQEQHTIKLLGTLPRQWLCFPLANRQRFMGVFVIQSYRDENEYSGMMVDVLYTISHVIASALDAFNIQQALLSANQELEQYQSELEKMVLQRTEQLQNSLAELQAEIVRREQLQRQLEHDSLHDNLTGLANRKYLYRELNRIGAKANRQECEVFALYLDLDDFKPINDNLGHAYGDLVLQEVSKRICKAVRGYDLVARLGGDEFVVILEHALSADELEIIARRIIDSLCLPINLGTHRVHCGVSIGIALAHTEDNITKHLLKWADQAMYHAKDSGKNRYYLASSSSD